VPISAEGRAADAPPLVATGLAAGYGGLPVISEVGISAGMGEVTAIVGPNGSGKSTLVKTLAGILPAMSGTITWFGEDIGADSQERRARQGMGYVPQEGEVFDALSVKENLEAGGYTMPKRAVRARVEELLELFPSLRGATSRSAGKLSGGERRMLAIARALMPGPKLLLLDEPTANLAPQYIESVLQEQLPRLAQSGVGVLVVEQRAWQVLACATHAYVMVSGQLAWQGLAADLATGDELAALFLGPSPLAREPAGVRTEQR
jgi:ABC-type branched-subunit amino acid transport system ATPase component